MLHARLINTFKCPISNGGIHLRRGHVEALLSHHADSGLLVDQSDEEAFDGGHDIEVDHVS